ncbi:MAG TPA: hypothetical protein VGR67_09110 [Candidatus Polarisedimenticolia bacterium]|jgi:hypothetical protein|nr:hypothetical protein [Candidatus Polarisedimenticolia bacterium]
MKASRSFSLFSPRSSPSIFFIVSLAFALMGAVSEAAAQTDALSTTIYRLGKTGTFQRGCFPPCLCPVMESGSERGTFALTFSGSDGLFNTYRVSEVNWTVSLPGGEVRVTGSGTYRVGGEFAVQHQLELDLKVGDNPVEHFDSGLVAGGGGFPRIDITISVHGQVCFDTVIHVDASPVPQAEIQAYRVLPESSFQRGCFGMCDCPVTEQGLRGSFSLVPVDQNPLFTEYSVVQVKWLVGPLPADVTSSGIPVRGFGTYRVGGEVAVQHQMGLDLTVGTEASAFFDSGLVSGGSNFPRIDIQIANEANSCVSTVIELHAKPAKLSPASPSLTTEPRY